MVKVWGSFDFIWPSHDPLKKRNGQTDGRTNGRTNGQTDKPTNGQTNNCQIYIRIEWTGLGCTVELFPSCRVERETKR